MLLTNFVTIAILIAGAASAPQGTRKNNAKTNANLNQIRGNGQGIQAAQQRAGSGVKIIEKIVQPTAGDPTFLQFRVAMPQTITPDMGLNVLLHGDGGQSFFAMPNAKLDSNLIGVTVLAPNAPMKWGGLGNNRPDGPQHATLVKDLVKSVLPQMMPGFNQSRVYFTGVSGGSLTLTSAMIPLYGSMFQSGWLIMCGGLPSPNGIPASAIGPNTRIHVQTTINELAFLKQSIPPALADLNQAIAKVPGITPQQAATQFTFDGTPNGGHCAFDGQGFSSGIQAVVSQFTALMLNGQPARGITAANLTPLAQARPFGAAAGQAQNRAKKSNAKNGANNANGRKGKK
ncbi:hypothetical protein CcCBS67573_g00590 [Chytriomyces confervae]|uniref:Phospholipase/carboxylesterase/thioesterase domain-containing protein n=1 Tax=Chytriomyces confervae TaxID=246404 RepID=A0A507FS25_9FUNG|nr:hypothetical protein CcCBS67573_g00590 [Chytriomyces confervae]